jgi:DNA-binding CsgD family transcriptional regulator
VYQRGGGVPLLTEALVNSDGALSPGLPSSLRDLLLAAVKALPERTQEALRIAAVGSVWLGHALLAAVTRLDDATLTAALRPAVDANVIVSDADGYAFRHQLIREAVLEDMLPGERAQAHRGFAEALEAGPSLSAEAPAAVQAALHWRGAHQDERALMAAWQAAAEAGAAYAQRLQMLEQVLELWDRVPDPSRPAGPDHVGVLELAADAARWAGEPERGLALAEAAIAELGESGDAERLASMLRRRAGLRQELLLPGQLDDLWAALRLASAPSRVRAQVLARLCWALKRENRYEESERLAGDLRALAGQLGDEEHQAEAAMVLAALGAYKGEDTVATLRGAREAAARAGSGLLEAWAYLTITDVLEGCGRHELAIQAGREGLARARQLGLARQIAAPIAGNLAESLTSAGRWDEALEILDEVLGLDLPPLGRFAPLLGRGQITVARGEEETAARTLRELRSLPAGVQAESQRVLPIARLEIDCRLAEGDLAGALDAGRAVLAFNLAADPRYSWPLLVTAVRACAEASVVSVPREAGDPERLRKDLELRASSIARLGPVHHAWAAAFAAEAARADGHQDLAGWDAAATAWETLAQPYPAAYALLRAAGAASAAGNREGAAIRLRRAAELASQLGARPLLEQISALARRARVDLPAAWGRGVSAAVPFGLTEREREVLRLVAAGRGNRDIAAELFISPKTASVHVSNILGKLGATTRGEAAAIAHRRHLLDER